MWGARIEIFVAESYRPLIDLEGTQRILGQVARNGYGEPACPRANLHNVVVRLQAMADHKLDRGVTELAEVSQSAGRVVVHWLCLLIGDDGKATPRSEEHTSELQSLMRISYAVFCLKKKKTDTYKQTTHITRRTKRTKTDQN